MRPRVIVGLLGWLATACLPFLLQQWYIQVLVQVSNNIFSNVKPIGVSLTLLIVSIIMLGAGFLAGWSWFGRKIEQFPQGYTFDPNGAILTKNGRELCSKCFFEKRREVPLKNNEGSDIKECILESAHRFKRINPQGAT
jgi:hypothetical protein